MKKNFRVLACLIVPTLLFACNEKVNIEPPVVVEELTKHHKIEQKIILDLRYFCNKEMEDGKCRKPFTRMNSAVKKLLKRHSVGGIILFAENIQTIKQTVTLTHALQKAAKKNSAHIPLLILIDQEGGKVTRLPQDWSSGMAGNMAIGAVPKALQGDMARDVGRVIGQELHMLGINVNHAPVLDVNVNPLNPVINTRSFSDDPAVVATLGIAFSEGLLSSGVASTLKHFPGHGDTHVDSHIGLPLVQHSRERVDAIDLFPFKKAIKAGKAPIIMTAHIQYPALDDTLITTKDGEKVIVPATFSRKIITDLLRHEYQYDGVVISDAMNMKAITNIADPEDAVVKTFAAGVDIAELPYSIRSMEDVDTFSGFIDAIAKTVAQDEALDASVSRIFSLKKLLNINENAEKPLRDKLMQAKAHFNRPDKRAVETRLAKQSVTLLKASGDDLQLADKAVLVIMPSGNLATAFGQSLSVRLKSKIEALAFADLTKEMLPDLIDAADVIIAGNITPPSSPVDLGGMADHLDGMTQDAKINLLLDDLFKMVREKEKKSIFVSLLFPTDAMIHIDNVDQAYALYNLKTRIGPNGVPVNASFDALADILAGNSQALGHLPMRLGHKLTIGADRDSLIGKLTQNKRLALMVNQSSLTKNGHLVDHLVANGATIEKLFAVEHGVRGKADAGEVVTDGRDSITGIAITSLYGAKKQPTASDLANVDVLVFDIQDVGVRFFTYISSLHYLMEGCAATHTPLVVLDRPNPNGAFIDGPVLKPEFKSFVGMHPIPILHGMTLGELARMINGEGWLKNGAVCDLTVVPIQNYRHSDPYALPVRPSPNLPNSQAIKLYPSLAFFEATDISVGRGTAFPFQVLGGVKQALGGFSFKPVSTPGAAKSPKHMNELLYGEDLRESPVNGLDLSIFLAWHKKMKAERLTLITNPKWLSKLAGTDKLGQQIEAGQSQEQIRASWQADLNVFKAKRKLYMLYPD